MFKLTQMLTFKMLWGSNSVLFLPVFVFYQIIPILISLCFFILYLFVKCYKAWFGQMWAYTVAIKYRNMKCYEEVLFHLWQG